MDTSTARSVRVIDNLIRGMNGLTKLLQDSRAALREPAVNQIAMRFASEFLTPLLLPQVELWRRARDVSKNFDS